MKLVIAVIQPSQLRAVRQALAQLGVERLTICDSQEFAKLDREDLVYRGVPYTTDVLRKITLEIAVNDDYLDRTLTAIAAAAQTGPRGKLGHGADGDGKIFVIPMDDAINAFDDSRGPGAI